MSDISIWLGRRVNYLGGEYEIESTLTETGDVRLLNEIGDGFTFSQQDFMTSVRKGFISISSAHRF